MSIKLMSQVWELKLQRGEQLTLLALADHANDDGRCYPSVARIAWKTNLDERTVQRHLSNLRGRGLIVPVRYEKGGRGHATEYELHLEKGVKKSPFVSEWVTAQTERVSPETERVTEEATKGDAGATRTISEPSVNHQRTARSSQKAKKPKALKPGRFYYCDKCDAAIPGYRVEEHIEHCDGNILTEGVA